MRMVTVIITGMNSFEGTNARRIEVENPPDNDLDLINKVISDLDLAGNGFDKILNITLIHHP